MSAQSRLKEHSHGLWRQVFFVLGVVSAIHIENQPAMWALVAIATTYHTAMALFWAMKWLKEGGS